MQQTQQLLNRW